MYLCYIDESGTPDVPGNTSHFVLAGISMPIRHWRGADQDISGVLARYDLADDELHTAWMLRKYLEQSKIPGFQSLSRERRRVEVTRWRTKELLRLQRLRNPRAYKQAKKTFAHTAAYIHLTLEERVSLVKDVADVVAGWGFARLFGEVIDKVHFDPTKAKRTVEEQAFEQVASRFNRYLQNGNDGEVSYGLLIHDNNQSVAKKHTALMRAFQTSGTLWTASLDHIIETPLFVDSKLTRMVQIADLCSYALRRYAENHEEDLFNRVFQRGDRVGAKVVGIRHYTDRNACRCTICRAHN